MSARLRERIYRNIAAQRRCFERESVRAKVRRAQSALMKLFNKFKSLDNAENLNERAWMAMAVELCAVATSLDASLWSRGGKPDADAMAKCFILCCKGKESEIGFVQFRRCLVYFAAELFKFAPDAKYAVPPFEEKLDLVLKWCAKLVLSDSHRDIKRRQHRRVVSPSKQ